MMDGNANDNLPPQSLCRTGCGFYGNQSFEGLCSKCYKDALKRKQNSSPVNSSSVMAGASNSQGQQDKITNTDPQIALTAVTSHSSVAYTSVVNPTTPTAHLSPSSLQTTTPCVDTATPTVQSLSVDRGTTDESGISATSASTAEGTSMVTSATTDGDDDEQQGDRKPKKNRCHTCKKKVGLTGFECRCGGLYCSLHRYSDKHDCSFDYRELAQEQIRKNNPVIKGDKLQKI